VNWIHLSEYGVLWRAFMNSVMSFPVAWKSKYSCTAEKLTASQEHLCSVE